MPVEYVSPSGMHPAPGFSHIAIDREKGYAFVAGQVALDEQFAIIGGDDLKAQTRAAMENVGKALAYLGAGWDQVVRRTIYTLDPTQFGPIAEAIEEVQGSDRHPAQTILGVTGLALPGLLIEIEVTVSL